MRNPNRIFLMVAIMAISFGVFSCKSQKKMAKKEAAAAEARKIAKAKADLEELLTDTVTPLAQKEQKLQAIKDMNIDDQEVKDLIAKVDDKLKAEREAQIAKEKAEREAREKQEQMDQAGSAKKDLPFYFKSIATATNTATANRNIDETLGLFASDDVPVLIIISQSGSAKDYDRPTTIRKYLEYLKDQKVDRNAINNVVYDSNGKITELELIKK